MSSQRAGRRLAGLVAALGVAACGSSGSSGTAGTGTSALGGSLAAFETKANAICISASAASRALAKPASAAGVKKYLDDDFPIIAGATKKLQALVAPPAEAAAYQSYVSAINQQLAVLRQAKADADRGDANAAISLAKSTGRGVQAKAHQAALAAHLTECAK